MRILFLHGWQSTPGGLKPTWLKEHGHDVLNPALPDDDFQGAVAAAQAVFDGHRPDVVVGSSRGGAVAMNIDSGDVPLVLLCPAWKRWGTATTVKPGTAILHAPGDDVVPFADSLELVRRSGLPAAALIRVGSGHRLADEESLRAMLEAAERAGAQRGDVPAADAFRTGDAGRRATIRTEAPGDYDAIRDILIAAFTGHPYSRCNEHRIVAALRKAAALTVGLVAELEGEVVGHVAFSPVKIDGRDCTWLALGPVAVAPAWQRQGVGSRLIETGLANLRALGAEGCVLVGDPAFYRRFGFQPHPALVLPGVPPQFFLCLPLGGSVPQGNVSHHAAFSVGE